MSTHTLALTAAVLLVTTGVSEAQELTLKDVLVRATRYVRALNNQLSGAVAEERYEQQATAPSSSNFGRFPRDGSQTIRRTLRSDYLLVQPQGSDRYYGFRDVFEVDGQAVRDREERLATLFLDPAAARDRQIYGILSDSARYNIGDVDRNFNTPTLALLFLRDSHKIRFTFERSSSGSPRLGLDLPEADGEMWVVEYEESALRLLLADPARSIRRGRQLFQRKFTRAQGLGPRVSDTASGDIIENPALGAGLAPARHRAHRDQDRVDRRRGHAPRGGRLRDQALRGGRAANQGPADPRAARAGDRGQDSSSGGRAAPQPGRAHRR